MLYSLKTWGSPAFRLLLLFQKDGCLIEQQLGIVGNTQNSPEVENELGGEGLVFIQGVCVHCRKMR